MAYFLQPREIALCLPEIQQILVVIFVVFTYDSAAVSVSLSTLIPTPAADVASSVTRDFFEHLDELL